MYSFCRVCLPGIALLAVAWYAPAAEVEKCWPSDTQVVVSVNVRQLLDSPVGKAHALAPLRAALQRNGQARQALEAVGLDPLRDIEQAFVTLPASTLGGQNEEGQKLLIGLRGTFDLARIEAAAEAHARAEPEQLKIHYAGSTRLYELRPKNQSSPGFAAFVNQNMLLVSPSRAYLAESLQAAARKSPTQLKEPVRSLVQKAECDLAVWVVAVLPPAVKQTLAANPQTAKYADKLVALTADVTVGEGIGAAVHLHTTDARSAEEIRRLLDGIKALAVLAAADQPEYGELAADFLSALQITADKSAVTIRGQLTAAQVGESLKKVEQP